MHSSRISLGLTGDATSWRDQERLEILRSYLAGKPRLSTQQDKYSFDPWKDAEV